MAATIRSVTIDLPGATYSFSPAEPWGDNPRFYAQQVEEQLASVASQMRAICEALYGTQETSSAGAK